MRLVTVNDSDVAPAEALTGSTATRLRDCPCGQQLDLCAGAHCPRCGRALTQS
jgi:hypothetical protein